MPLSGVRSQRWSCRCSRSNRDALDVVAAFMTAPGRFSGGVVDYDGPIAADYSAARALSNEAALVWRSAVAPFIPPSAPTILDLGAGTGRFSSLLADFHGARVIGVEPSRGMLRVAMQRARPTIAYICGFAEQIPLRDSSCHVVWMSHVLHHIRKRRACARELRRVVIPLGRVLVRGTFADRLDGFATLFRFFPGARRICEEFPTTSETVTVFESAGFTVESHQRIQQRVCGSLREFAERTRRRADTSLALLADSEFQAGMAALEEAAARETEPIPVHETLDFVVFQRCHEVPAA